MSDKKTYHLQYFAILREQCGANDETIQTNAQTPHALYEELRGTYGFTLPPERIKVAVNDEFAEMDTTLNGGETIVFIPPVAGG